MAKLIELLPSQTLKHTVMPDLEIDGLSFDSRAIKAGDVFFALPGSRSNGTDFAQQALAAGAVAVVGETPPTAFSGPAIQVPNARQALSEMSCRFFDNPSAKMQLIGITGTKGKTTTTYLLQAILRQHYENAFRLGTVDYDLVYTTRSAANTTPESLVLHSIFADLLRRNVQAGVMEVSSHALKTFRVEHVSFAAAGFCNLSLEHTEFHPTMEDYYQAKRRLFLELLPSGRPAIINIEDNYGKALVSDCRAHGLRPLTLGVESTEADISAWPQATNSPTRTLFELAFPDRDRLLLDLPLVGRFNIENAMMAAGLAYSLGIPAEVIRQGLGSVRNVPGRFESIANTGGFLVIVDYAHSPAALENVLRAARSLAAKRLITVFGCGGERSSAKRPIMGRLSAHLADITVITSDNPRREDPAAIIAEILAGVNEPMTDQRGEVHTQVDRRAAIHRACAIAQPGDVIVIAGKGHETGQTFADTIVPFDDRQVAREILKELGYA